MACGKGPTIRANNGVPVIVFDTTELELPWYVNGVEVGVARAGLWSV